MRRMVSLLHFVDWLKQLGRALGMLRHLWEPPVAHDLLHAGKERVQLHRLRDKCRSPTVGSPPLPFPGIVHAKANKRGMRPGWQTPQGRDELFELHPRELNIENNQVEGEHGGKGRLLVDKSSDFAAVPEDQHPTRKRTLLESFLE